jgi:hypothetical protein
MILRAATGAKELWRVPGALHTGALGAATEEYRSRVFTFFDHQLVRGNGQMVHVTRKPD